MKDERYGLIGHPISHSMSPRVFSAAYGGKLPYDLIEESDFDKAWERFKNGYKAINVTAPFKEIAFERADIISPECEIIKATNLLLKTPDGIIAHNSDYLGVLAILEAEGIGPDSTVVIAGWGGAAKAAAAAAKKLEADVVICNRSTSKGEGIRPLEELFMLCNVADMLIYTLPVPIDDLGSVSCPLIMEANYKNPSIDAAAVERKGGRYIHGSEWLKYQAICGYSIMTGMEPDTNAIQSVFTTDKK